MQDLQQLWTGLLEKWLRISVRDRWVLSAFALFLVLMVLYMAIVRPINQYRHNASSRYSSNVELATWIETHRARFSASNTNNSQVSNRGGRSLVALVNESSREYQLDISRVEPKAQNIVRLWLDAVKFNELITWFDVLHEQYGIAIQDISIDQTDTAGVVRVNVTFRG